MAKRSKRRGKGKKPDKYAKQKMLAIPVLLAVLGYVLVDNFGGSSEDTAPQAAAAVQQQRPANALNPQIAAVENSVQKVEAWPAPQLDFLDGPSPMASYREAAGEIVRTATSQPENMVAIEQVEKKNEVESSIRETLSTQASQFVFKSANRKLALVGDRIVEQGEQLDNGARLRDVRGSSLIIEVGRRID
ncbi:MAG: hypothetical protein Aurels2KO_13750 [Aureliella sp.]